MRSYSRTVADMATEPHVEIVILDEQRGSTNSEKRSEDQACSGWLVYQTQPDGTDVMINVSRSTDLRTRSVVLASYRHVPNVRVEPEDG